MTLSKSKIISYFNKRIQWLKVKKDKTGLIHAFLRDFGTKESKCGRWYLFNDRENLPTETYEETLKCKECKKIIKIEIEDGFRNQEKYPKRKRSWRDEIDLRRDNERAFARMRNEARGNQR